MTQSNPTSGDPEPPDDSRSSADEYATLVGGEAGEASSRHVTASRPNQSLDTVGQPVETTFPSAPTGESTLRFRVLRPHAKGGLGQVLEAHDHELRRTVAVKEIQPQYAHLAESQARFIFEAEVTGRLEHPGIVPIYALGRHADGRPYYAMRFISGRPMSDAIARLHAPKNVDEFNRGLRELLQRLVTVCNTIDFAHSRGYVHRDLKPSNIMLGDYAETLVVDWGLAKHVGTPSVSPRDVSGDSQEAATSSASHKQESEDELDTKIVDEETSRETIGSSDEANPSDPEATIRTVWEKQPAIQERVPNAHAREGEHTRAGRTVGTPRYMAPEQAAGRIEEVGPRSDIYSLGATLYHLLTGQAPLSGSPSLSIQGLLKRVMDGTIPAPIEIQPSVPKALDAICRHAMSVQPESRYASAKMLAGDIESYLVDEPVSVVSESWLDQAGRWTRKHRGITTTVAGSLITVAIVASIFLFVTRQALDRTQRYLTISQLQQQFDTQVNQEEQRQNRSGIQVKDIPVADGFVTSSEQLIRKLESLRQVDEPAFLDRNRREALLQTWVASIDRLRQQRMNRQRHQDLLIEVDRLEQDFPFAADKRFTEQTIRLREQALQRISQWFPLDLPEPPPTPLSTEMGNQFEMSQFGGGITIADSPPGNVELSVQFGGDLSAAKAIGLILNESDVSGYQFVLADQDYHPVYGSDSLPSLQQSSDRGRLVAMIIRGADVLRMLPVTMTQDFKRLTARREQGTLLTLIYGDQQLRFVDLFPLKTQSPGRVGLIYPPSVTVNDVALETQRMATASLDLPRPSASNAIELGDQSFARGDYAKARQSYERLPANVEALAKRALVLEVVDPDQYAIALSEIVENHSPAGVEDESARRWYLYAGVRLFLHHLRQSDEQILATEVLSSLKVNYTLEDVQSLIPESERHLFSEALIKPGKRTRVLFDNTGDLESLDDAIDLFSNNSNWRRLAYWRKSDALRYDEQLDPGEARDQAASILDRLIEEMRQDPSLDALTLVTLVADRVWLHLLDRRFESAHELINRYLPDAFATIPADRLPLLIERARVLIGEADFLEGQVSEGDRESGNQEQIVSKLEQARDALVAFTKRVDPSRPPTGIHYTHFGGAHAMLGLMEERAGRAKEAQTWWQRGRRRNWKPYSFDPSRMVTVRGAEMILEGESPEPFLSAWTDGYRGNEWREIVEELLAGSGLNDFATRNLILNSDQLPNEWIQTVAEKVFSGPRGRRIGQQTLLHQIPLAQSNTDGVALILYQAVLHLALEGEDDLNRYPELDQLLFDRCQRIIQSFQDGKFGWNEMAFILSAFTGSWNENSFDQLKRRLSDQDLTAGLAMVFAMMQLNQQNDWEKANDIVKKHVRPLAAKLPSLYLEVCDDKLDLRKP